VKLTEAQINSLRVTLIIFEERLDEIIGLCETDEKKGILYHIKNNLTEQETRQIKDRIAEFKKVIGQLTQQLNLEKEKSYTKKIISGYFSILWVGLCSLESKRLENYGEVDESVEKELDPIANRLTKSVLEIIRSLKSS
jgi:predicted phage-related endonuclease